MRSGVAVLARKSACYDSGGGTVHYVLYIRFYGFIEIFAYCFSFKKIFSFINVVVVCGCISP